MKLLNAVHGLFSGPSTVPALKFDQEISNKPSFQGTVSYHWVILRTGDVLQVGHGHMFEHPRCLAVAGPDLPPPFFNLDLGSCWNSVRDIWIWHMDLVHPVHPVINPLKLGCLAVDFWGVYPWANANHGGLEWTWTAWWVLQVPSWDAGFDIIWMCIWQVDRVQDLNIHDLYIQNRFLLEKEDLKKHVDISDWWWMGEPPSSLVFNNADWMYQD